MKLHNFIMKTVKDNFFMKLIKSNTGVSSKNFFLVCTTLIGLILLSVLIGGLIVDIVFNHTITISMSEAAYFIGAVGSLFAAAGLTKAGSEWSENKYIYNTHRNHSQRVEEDTEDVPLPDEEICEDE